MQILCRQSLYRKSSNECIVVNTIQYYSILNNSEIKLNIFQKSENISFNMNVVYAIKKNVKTLLTNALV
jgi:hypothetical protein